MRCHYIYDEQAGKVHIPGCMGSAVYGPRRCTCYPIKTKPEAANKKDQHIKDLEKQNAQLWRIIKKLIQGRRPSIIIENLD